MTVCLEGSLPKIPNMRRILMVLASPNSVPITHDTNSDSRRPDVNAICVLLED